MGPLELSSSISDSDPLLVVFASQTGNAREAAFEIACDLVKKRIPCRLCSTEVFWNVVRNRSTNDGCPSLSKTFTSQDRYVTFVVSTTGQGDVPDDMVELWTSLLSSRWQKDSWKCCRFTVFGLGDSRYLEFNFAARKLYARLLQLGAQSFYRLGLGDDQHDFGYEGELDAWKNQLLYEMDTSREQAAHERDIGANSETIETLDNKLLPPDFFVTMADIDTVQIAHQEDCATAATRTSQRKAGGKTHWIDATLCRNHVLHAATLSESWVIGRVNFKRRLTPSNHFQGVYHIQLSVPTESAEGAFPLFQPGDCLAVLPVVPVDLVLHFIQDILHRHPEERVTIRRRTTSLWHTSNIFGCPLGTTTSRMPENTECCLSLFDVFRYHLDITAVPTRYFFRALSVFSTDPLHQEKLEALSGSSLESKDAYYEYCKSEKRSVAEVLWDFGSSCSTIPLDYLLSIIPPIAPRKYSIASYHLWYSKPLWWSLAAPSVVHWPYVWSVGAPLLVIHQLARITKRDTQPWKQVISRMLGKCMPAIRHFAFTECEPSVMAAENIMKRIQQRIWKERWEQLIMNKPAPSSNCNGLQAASSRLKSHVLVDLCIAEVSQTTKLQRQVKGFCSHYLASLQEGDELAVAFTRGPTWGSSWQPPVSAPLLLICPGTGIAPCRALIQQRYLQSRSHEILQNEMTDVLPEETTSISRLPACMAPPQIPGSVLLVFGCRHPKRDFLFEKDWHQLCDVETPVKRCEAFSLKDPSMFMKKLLNCWHYTIGSIPWFWIRHILEVSKVAHLFPFLFHSTSWSLSLLLAFSRVTEKRKVYVQDVLEERANAEVARFLTLPASLRTGSEKDVPEEPVIIISGRSHPMPSQVLRALQDIIASQNKNVQWTDALLKRVFEEKRKRKKLVFETWG